ncbi:MAG: RNA 2',3'-cyclic phosphodiesterase [Actinomycetota bacterium]
MRLFVAVDLPATVKDELDRLIAALRPSIPDAKWVPRDNIHLTLSFLGEVGDERVEPIVEALRGVAASRARIATRLSGSGAFPSPRRARVLWAGLEGEELPALAAVTAEALEPLGFPREARAWTAHLTLARFREPADVRGLLPLRLEEVSLDVIELTLFRSRLARPAPRYEPVTRVPFGS